MRVSIFFLVLALSFLPAPNSRATEQNNLDPVMKLELKRLEELWHVLDHVAENIWPGWHGYAEVPFMFFYENGVRMLVGHPEPPAEFERVNGIEAAGRKVYLDSRNEVPVELFWPVSGGGGPHNFGRHEGEHVQTIFINIRCRRDSTKKETDKEPWGLACENQILLYVHELFHVFQNSFYPFEHGNLHYTPDANYAIYSEIEGEALLRAYTEEENNESIEYLKDFVVARKQKYRSMADIEQKQEMDEDFMEGTATYSEFATLQRVSDGFEPAKTEKELSYYYGFQNLDYFFDTRLETLKGASRLTHESLFKCYHYGCFQALLLDRFVPGWKKRITERQNFLYDIIVEFLEMDEKEEERIAGRIKEKYDYDAVSARHSPVIEARDNAFTDFYSQVGRIYIVNFKPTNEYVYAFPDSGEETCTMGLRHLYPNGVKKIQIHEVSLEGKGKPILLDQIYHLRYVDTENEDFEIEFSEKEGLVYYDAVVNTTGFSLKAPKIRVKERDNRVKFIVLSKVSED